MEKNVLYAHAVNWARLQPSTSISVHYKLVHSKIVQIIWKKMFNMFSNVYDTYYNSYFNI